MAKKITDQKTIDTIIVSINVGLSETEIVKSSIGRKPIRRIATEYGLSERLKYNNSIYKSKRLVEFRQNNRHKICLELDKKYESLILKCLDSGGILKNIISIMKGVPHKQILYYLKYKKLDVLRKENSKKFVVIQSQINGRKAIPITKGVDLKPITPEIIKRFEELKTQLIYKQRVYDALKNEFGFGERKYYQLCKLYGYPENNPQTGKLNPMFGKSPGKGAGIGVKCWILFDGIKYFCRSSLELKVMCYLNDNGEKFQISKHRISYIDDSGIDRTYCPDIVINNKIYEIKPYNMLKIKLNLLKSEALKKYCKKYNLLYGGYLTELNTDITKYDLKYLTALIVSGKIIIDTLNLEKLKRNII